MLAVAAFIGINFSYKSIRENANQFYHELNFRDIELTSTLLLGEEEIDELKAMDGVVDVEECYYIPVKTIKGDGFKDINVVSLTERINTVKVLEGRLPENKNECVIEQELSSILSLSIGDRITVIDAEGEAPEYLLDNTYTITGVVQHPDLFSHEAQVPVNRYILVLPEAFDHEALDNSCMKALLRIDKPEGISYFDKKYRSALKKEKSILENWSKNGEVRRLATVKEKALEKIEPYEKEVADGEEALKEARQKLDDGWWWSQCQHREKDLGEDWWLQDLQCGPCPP